MKDNNFRIDISVPANSTAKVYVPAKESSGVMEGDISADKANGVRFVEVENGCAVYLVDSGRYAFTSIA